MNERTTLKVRRVELREKRQQLDHACQEMREGVRAMLSPIDAIVTLDLDTALDRLLILKQQQEELVGIDTRIRILNENLDG